eukprot:CAMPEP_0115114748 /NCGR_PEP_ID=MMETSP0227-20121206/42255_1 /TAXON_ID=89957 /ORGANISM="Polarella glacialis, Strain CCMP 1383" /LENGTH=80 /DNA_ID=CAMNT_0002515235 /DNA_START=504 /DNA_END=746 /DNA_ORIENTATION=-
MMLQLICRIAKVDEFDLRTRWPNIAGCCSTGRRSLVQLLPLCLTRKTRRLRRLSRREKDVLQLQISMREIEVAMKEPQSR